jgi:hypothetical protein
VVIGSQAVLGQFPNAPAELLVSIEADVFTFRDPADADLIDGSIGEGSPFHQTFGYYAHGVAEDTATLPAGWKDRLIRVRNENTVKAVVCAWWHMVSPSQNLPLAAKRIRPSFPNSSATSWQTPRRSSPACNKRR